MNVKVMSMNGKPAGTIKAYPFRDYAIHLFK